MTFEIDSNNIQNEDVQLTTDANGDLIIEHIPTGATFVYDQANDNWKPSGGLDIGGNDITNAGAVNADSADITNNLLAGQVGTSSEPVDVAAATVTADIVNAGSVNAARTFADNIVVSQETANSLTTHEAASFTVSSNSYGTIFDLANPVDVVSGTVCGFAPNQFRVTWDDGNTDTIYSQSGLVGTDGGGDIFGVNTVPPIESITKIEFYNGSGSDRDYGYKVLTI